MSSIYMLKIEIDAHFQGGEAARPWVAEVSAPDPKYGLRRSFVEAKTDWKDARRAWSGNVYGRVAYFPLRDGRLYEVSRYRGTSSKRHLAREYLAIAGGKRSKLTAEEALARLDGGGEALVLRMDEDRSPDTWVARVTGIGTPERLGFAHDSGRRLYRLRDGVHEIREGDSSRLVLVEGAMPRTISQAEALRCLAR